MKNFLDDFDNHIPQSISNKYEKLLYTSTNQKQERMKFIYETGKMNLEQLVTKIDRFKENEIASIVEFYLLMFKDCKILPKTIHPIKIQFHDEEIKFLFHESTLNPRRVMINNDYFISPEETNLVNEINVETEISPIIWKVGILCLYLADFIIPRSDIHFMRVLFMVSIGTNLPKLKRQSDWSNEFNHFIESCLKHDAKKRLTIEELLHHPFLTDALTEEDFLDKFLHKNKKKRIYEKVYSKQHFVDILFRGY